MKPKIIFSLVFIFFLVVLVSFLDFFYPLDKTNENFAPDISSSYLEYFVIVPFFLIFISFLSDLKFNLKVKIILLLLSLIIFTIIYIYYLPNRDLRLYG
jgi:hypothetical protein